MTKLLNEKYQEYFMGPIITIKEVEIIEEYENYTALVVMDRVERLVRWSPCGGGFAMKPVGSLQNHSARA